MSFIGTYTAATTTPPTIAAGTTMVETTGYAASGDGGSARFKFAGATAPASGPKFQDSAGNWWGLAEKVVNNLMFGALPGGSATLNTTRLNDFFAYCAAVPCESAHVMGALNVDGPLTCTLDSATTFHMVWTGKITATAAVETVLTLEAVGRLVRVDGIIRVWGQITGGSDAYVNRTCQVGVRLKNTARGRIEGIEAVNFRYAGVLLNSSNTNENGTRIGNVYAKRCSSGYKGDSLTANWSNRTDAGSSDNVSQTTTITVSQLPDSYTQSAVGPKFVVIGDASGNSERVHLITLFDPANSALTISPWPDPAFGTSGTLRYMFGAGLSVNGSDANFVNVETADVTQNGIGIVSNGLYGVVCDTLAAHNNGAGIAIGGDLADAHVDMTITYAYLENNNFDIVRTTRASIGLHVEAQATLNLARVEVAAAPWSTAIGGRNRGYAGLGTSTVQSNNGFLAYQKAGYNYLPKLNFFPHRPAQDGAIFRKDTLSVELEPLDMGVNGRFGYDGGRLTVLGSGASAQPTGTITFTAPPSTTFSAQTTSGSPVLDAISGTAFLVPGQTVTGTNIPVNTTILSVDPFGKKATMSANATGSANPVTVTASAWTVSGGTGSGTTTAFSSLTKPADFAIYYDIAARNVIVRNLAA